MTPEDNTFANEEFDLGDPLRPLFEKWWVVAGVVAFAVMLALLITRQQSDVYEARTKLLIVAPVSERLLVREINDGASEPVTRILGTSLSVDTLSALATANDLLQKIILDLNLRDSTGARHWGAEQLASMMNPAVSTAGRTGSEGPLPLLTMTVRGSNPALLKRIANKWAEVFTEKNSELLAAEALRSYDFVTTRYQENQETLRDKQEAKLAYQQNYSLVQFQTELKVTTAGYEDVSNQLESKRAALADASARLVYYDESLEELHRKRAAKLEYSKSNALEPLRSKLAVATASYEDFLSQLEKDQAAVAAEKARLQSLETALTEETRVLMIRRTISSESLFQVLANGISPERLDALSDLEVESEELNPIYFQLKQQQLDAQTAFATRSAEVSDLRSRTAELRDTMEQTANLMGEVELQLSELDDETAALDFDGSLVEKLSKARADVSVLISTISDLEARQAELASEAQDLSGRIAEILVELSLFDQEIGVIKTNLARMAQNVIEAQIAKAEQEGSIRVVESAVSPQVPIGPDRRLNIVLAGGLGLVLGSALAYGMHYVQQPRGRRPTSQTHWVRGGG